jgi:hypothetical protein
MHVAFQGSLPQWSRHKKRLPTAHTHRQSRFQTRPRHKCL